MWHFFLKDSWVPEFTVMEYLCLLHLLATSSCPSSDIFRIYFLYIWGDYSSFIIFFDWPNLQCNTGQNVNFQATINLLNQYSLSSLETFTELKKDPQNKIDQFGASCGRKLGGAARRLWPRVQGLLRGGESKGNLRFQRLWSWVMATGEEERRRRSKMLVRLVAIIMILGSVKGKENSLKIVTLFSKGDSWHPEFKFTRAGKLSRDIFIIIQRWIFLVIWLSRKLKYIFFILSKY